MHTSDHARVTRAQLGNISLWCMKCSRVVAEADVHKSAIENQKDFVKAWGEHVEQADYVMDFQI